MKQNHINWIITGTSQYNSEIFFVESKLPQPPRIGTSFFTRLHLPICSFSTHWYAPSMAATVACRQCWVPVSVSLYNQKHAYTSQVMGTLLIIPASSAHGCRFACTHSHPGRGAAVFSHLSSPILCVVALDRFLLNKCKKGKGFWPSRCVLEWLGSVFASSPNWNFLWMKSLHKWQIECGLQSRM